MARLMSQTRGGFYAAHPTAVAAVLKRLRPPAVGECHVFDPCAGEGMALLQLAQELDAEPYAIELSEDRAALVAALLGDQALAPADFFRCFVSHNTFSLAWVNPNYDHMTGGGRVETAFIYKAVNLLADGGILALVCPENIARDYDTINVFEERCDNISALPFPGSVRKYNEVVVLGRKRRSLAAIGSRWNSRDWLESKLQQNIVYTLPAGQRPKVFRVTEPTDAELVRLVAGSPLRFLTDPPADKEDYRPRPPMSICQGHRALLLASGHVDGLICPPDEPPHLIRGTACKSQYVSACDTTEDDDGNSITRTVLSERPQLIIRVLSADGEIVTLE